MFAIRTQHCYLSHFCLVSIFSSLRSYSSLCLVVDFASAHLLLISLTTLLFLILLSSSLHRFAFLFFGAVLYLHYRSLFFNCFCYWSLCFSSCLPWFLLCWTTYYYFLLLLLRKVCLYLRVQFLCSLPIFCR